MTCLLENVTFNLSDRIAPCDLVLPLFPCQVELFSWESNKKINHQTCNKLQQRSHLYLNKSILPPMKLSPIATLSVCESNRCWIMKSQIALRLPTAFNGVCVESRIVDSALMLWNRKSPCLSCSSLAFIQNQIYLNATVPNLPCSVAVAVVPFLICQDEKL